VVSGEVEKKGLAGRIKEFRSILKAAQRSESLRFYVDGDAVTDVFWEHSKIETGSKTSLWQTGNKSAASWFTSAASALLQRKGSRCRLRGQKWTRAAGVDWSGGRRWARAGEGR
jgi:hypothetical protein